MSRHGHRFFVPEHLTEHLEVLLPANQSRQISEVLRLKNGDEIRLFNGDGSEYVAIIDSNDRATTKVTVAGSQPGISLPDPSIDLALALLKADRFEWALQKVTELGVSRIVPLVTEHSVIALRVDRAERRQKRWKRIVIEAAEQSGRCTVPEIASVSTLVDLLAEPTGHQMILLWENEQRTLLSSMQFDSMRPLLLVVGPEGGFSDAELDLATHAGAATASLGKLTLRSETAAVAATAIVAGRLAPLI